MGGTDRLRVSSQSLKRTWRTSDIFEAALSGHVGDRTKLFGVEVFLFLIRKNVDYKTALGTAINIAGVFGKNESVIDLKKKKDTEKQKILTRLQKKWRSWDKEKLGVAEYPLEKLNDLQKS